MTDFQGNLLTSFTISGEKEPNRALKGSRGFDRDGQLMTKIVTLFHVEFFQAVAQLPETQPEQLGGGRFIPTGLLQRL
jgi:hypothetical protein